MIVLPLCCPEGFSVRIVAHLDPASLPISVDTITASPSLLDSLGSEGASGDYHCEATEGSNGGERASEDEHHKTTPSSTIESTDSGAKYWDASEEW